MKKIYVLVSVLFTLLGLGASTALAASSKVKGNFNSVMRGQLAQSRLTQQATILGMTADDLKSQLTAGTKLSDIIIAKGMTQDQFNTAMTAAMQAQMKQHLQDLVTQSKITQAQADTMLQNMQNKSLSTNGRIFGVRHELRGFGNQGTK